MIMACDLCGRIGFSRFRTGILTHPKWQSRVIDGAEMRRIGLGTVENIEVYLFKLDPTQA